MKIDKNLKYYFVVTCLLFGLLAQSQTKGQDLNVKIGTRIEIKSEILNESRNIIIHLPGNYHNTEKIFPVLYRLDGNTKAMIETVATTNRLAQTEEVIPELIIVAIENTNRSRDMWPVNTDYYPEPNIAGALNFLDFIEKELIPYIENEYCANEKRILCGQSLSAMFTIYAFLDKPKIFNAYIACSGAFPDCEDYFTGLSHEAFQQADQFCDKDIFISNGLQDPLDPDGEYHNQILYFSKDMKVRLGIGSRIKYQTYEHEGHVPFFSLYDGLKFIFLQE